MKSFIHKLQNKQNLTRSEAFGMQKQIISGKVSKKEIIKIFEAFEEKDITANELIGIIKATRKNMLRLKLDFDVLDTCGTGGDGLNTFNISTVTAIVCASLGIPVAKHGNRAASSQCGAADVLEKLGVKIGLNATQAKRCLYECGLVFLFAPNFHPALKYAMAARKEYGKRTYFNFIGPMLNPAGAKYQLLGISDFTKAEIMGKTLVNTGSKRMMIIHGAEGIDEISVSGETRVFVFKKGSEKPIKYKISPKNFGLKIFPLEEIKGGSVEKNAEILMNVLKNKGSEAQMNAVLLNSAAAIFTFGKAKTMKEGVALTQEAIKSGKALRKLKESIEVSNKILKRHNMAKNKIYYQKSNSLLDKICEHKIKEIKEAISNTSLKGLKLKIRESKFGSRKFAAALTKPGISLLTEIKKSSPTNKGVFFRDDFDVAEIAKTFDQHGASAISVITEKKFFRGRLNFIPLVKVNSSLPILQKDFIFHPYQIYQAKAYGTDAVLLISAILYPNQLKELYELTYELGMDALVEVHTKSELTGALKINPKILGVNNRNLKTMEVDISTFPKLAREIPKGITKVAESGIETYKDVKLMQESGADAILVGTLLMKSADIGKALDKLLERRG